MHESDMWIAPASNLSPHNSISHPTTKNMDDVLHLIGTGISVIGVGAAYGTYLLIFMNTLVIWSYS
jgi:hypothetical protein